MANRVSRSAARRLASRVVFPDPRNPVKIVTGSAGTLSLLLAVRPYERAYSCHCSQSVQGFDQEGIEHRSSPQRSPLGASVGETRYLHALAQLRFALHGADEANGEANHQLRSPPFFLNEPERFVYSRRIITQSQHEIVAEPLIRQAYAGCSRREASGGREQGSFAFLHPALGRDRYVLQEAGLDTAFHQGDIRHDAPTPQQSAYASFNCPRRQEQIVDKRQVSRSLHQALDDVFFRVREVRPVACRLDDAEIFGLERGRHIAVPGTLQRDAGHWPVVW